MMHQRKVSSIAYVPEVSNLQNFIVFDGFIPSIEGYQPQVLFSRLNVEYNSNFAVNQAGLLMTFMKFTARFTNELPCDYIATAIHEISILELGNNVWMSVQRQQGEFYNRDLLHSILKSCQNIYMLFFPLPERDENGYITENSLKIIKSAFDMIVNSITWADLGFIHLFDSFFQMKLSALFLFRLTPLVDDLRSDDSPIAHIAIMYSRFFLFHTFPIEIARTIAISMRIKLPYLFPKVLTKDEEHLYWIIGMNKSSTGNVAIYAPPIRISNQEYPLIALRLKKLKFIIAIKPDVIITPNLLVQVPQMLHNLLHLFKNFKVDVVNGKIPGPYIVIQNDTVDRRLILSHEKLSDSTIPIAENNIFMGHSFVTSVARRASVIFPGPLDYLLYFKRGEKEETVVMTKCDSKYLADGINKCEKLTNISNVKRIEIDETE